MMGTQPRAIVRTTRARVEVSCRFRGTQLPRESGQDLTRLISSAVFAHERKCGQCDTSSAWERGDPTYHAAFREAAHSTQDQLDRVRTGGYLR